MANPEDIADPELIARLSAWFGDGGQIIATPPVFTPPPERTSLAHLEDAIDPRLVSRLERHDTAPERLLIWSSRPLESQIDVSLGKLRVPPAPTEGAEEEYWQPQDIRAALDEHNTPQAVLRDLFRPVMYFGDIALRPIETGLERLGEDPTAVVRAAIGEPVTPELDQVPSAMIAEDIADLRDILAAPWADSKPEAPTRQALVPDYEHYTWFGVEGGYDPDV